MAIQLSVAGQAHVACTLTESYIECKNQQVHKMVERPKLNARGGMFDLVRRMGRRNCGGAFAGLVGTKPPTSPAQAGYDMRVEWLADSLGRFTLRHLRHLWHLSIFPHGFLFATQRPPF